MDFIDPLLNLYSENHTSNETSVLSALSRETNAKVLMPRMLSGHLQGRILSMISHMIRPKSILEIGTYTGYSAICLAEGLSEDGKLYTIDINDELTPMVEKYIKLAGLTERIQVITGNALDVIPTLKHSFDLVFIDADKINYSKYYDLVIDQMNSGSFILVDNVLWSGKILADPEKMDSDTKAIHEFNTKVKDDIRVEKVLLPVRDGLLLIRKK